MLAIVGCLLSSPAGAVDLMKFKGAPAAPALGLPDLSGKIHDLAAYRGRVVVVNFWATWCAPCVREIPAMERAQAELAGAGVVFLAVNADQRRGIVERFARRLGIGFPVLLDEGGHASRRWHVRALPVSYVVSPEGRVVLGVIGDHRWDSPATLRRLAALAQGTQ